MKICLITQIYNEENRILDWIKYHKKIGIDRILIYDDLSVDNTEQIVGDYIKTDDSVSMHFSDKKVRSNIKFNSGNDYAGNEDIHQRIIRSYNSGLKLIKEEWKTDTFESYDHKFENYEISYLDSLVKKDYSGKTIDLKNLSSDSKVRIEKVINEAKEIEFDPHLVFFLDVDEYISLQNHENIKDELEGLDFSEFDRFFALSFDMMPPLSKKYDSSPVYLQSRNRWSNHTRFYESGWESRTKMMVLANTCESIWSVHLSDIKEYHEKSISILSDEMVIRNKKGEYATILKASKNRIRLLHYRDFPQAEAHCEIYDEHDDSVEKIMSK